MKCILFFQTRSDTATSCQIYLDGDVHAGRSRTGTEPGQRLLQAHVARIVRGGAVVGRSRRTTDPRPDGGQVRKTKVLYRSAGQW